MTPLGAHSTSPVRITRLPLPFVTTPNSPSSTYANSSTGASCSSPLNPGGNTNSYIVPRSFSSTFRSSTRPCPVPLPGATPTPTAMPAPNTTATPSDMVHPRRTRFNPAVAERTRFNMKSSQQVIDRVRAPALPAQSCSRERQEGACCQECDERRPGSARGRSPFADKATTSPSGSNISSHRGPLRQIQPALLRALRELLRQGEAHVLLHHVDLAHLHPVAAQRRHRLGDEHLGRGG